jgi:hypothetical protein
VPGGQDRAVAWPVEARTDPFERTVPVLHQGTPVGEIAISKPEREPITSAEAKLLADLAAQAGPAFKNVRLDLELQARLEELQASRQRIVTAQDAERRRPERDIHDGAQQQFVAIAIRMRVQASSWPGHVRDRDCRTWPIELPPWAACWRFAPRRASGQPWLAECPLQHRRKPLSPQGRNRPPAA